MMRKSVFLNQHRFVSFVATSLVVVLSIGRSTSAADWPTWGGNAARTGTTPAGLPDELHLNWVLKLREPDAAWHSNQPRVQFDRAYEPIVANGRMFIGSMVSDSITAYDTKTGHELWRFYTEGPVRLAPTIYKDRVYAVSDDGYLYCLNAEDGSVHWKFFGAPFDRKIIGNDRLTSIFPARGAPVVYDNTLYFATSIWPMMGVFIHAINPETGEVVWTNSGTGSMYIPQQHDRPAFAGISPQGYLTATEDYLVVAGGQTAPAILDRRTGKFSHVNLHSRQMTTKGGGGYRVRATNDFFVVSQDLFRMSDSSYLGKVHDPVITDDSIIGFDKDTIMRSYAHEMEIEEIVDRKGRPATRAKFNEQWSGSFYPYLTKVYCKAGERFFGKAPKGIIAAFDPPASPGEHDVHWSARVEGEPLTMIPADDRLFVSTDQGMIYCYSGEEPPGAGPRVISAVSNGDNEPETAQDDASASAPKNIRIQRLLKELEISRGYGIVLGIGDGQLLNTLLTHSKLNLIVLEKDETKIASHRRRLDHAGIYGHRISILTGDLSSVQLPPYLAHLIIANDPISAGVDSNDRFVEQLFHSLRPYGGVACVNLPAERHTEFSTRVQRDKLANGLVSRSSDDSFTLLTRMGALPGSDDWTHQYANSSNSVVSKDKLVKSPMGVLWFGGPSNEKVLPRHGHGPNPQVAGGRLYIEGRNMLRCVDVYTGILLWEREFLDVGKNYDHTSHEPGAGAIGSNYVSLEDNVYLIQGDTCYRLDAATGETLTRFKTPVTPGTKKRPDWGFISVHGDVLVAGIQPVDFKTPAFNNREMRRQKKEFFDIIRQWKNFTPTGLDDGGWPPQTIVENLNRLIYGFGMISKIPEDVRKQAGANALETQLQKYLAEGGEEREKDNTGLLLKRRLLTKYYKLPAYRAPRTGTYAAYSRRSSQRLAGLDRRSGEKLWDVSAQFSFRHNTIASGNGKVFVLDRLDDALQQHRRRRGEKQPDQSRILAIDIKTGKELWNSHRRIFGTFLNYSEEHDVVLQAGSAAGDRAMDESSKGMVAYRGKDGTELWENDRSYSGPLMLHHDTVYSQPNPGLALNLLTGEQLKRQHPISGQPTDWSYCREGGCNTAIGSEHLITFRSSAAGFFDLAKDGGTGNWGGFRSSCSSNLIPANGVLNAPDYTRTCSCAFQNRSSLALVHMPEVDVWTFNRFNWDGKRVQRAGINFGAPGDRRAPDGQLWLDFPSVGGSSPDIPVTVEGDKVEYFRQHPTYISDGDYKWVACSGVRGASRISISVDESSDTPAQPYTVRLYFAETEDDDTSERSFDVLLQNQKVLSDFSIRKSSGTPRTSIVKEFRGIPIGNALEITLKAKSGNTIISGVELIAESP